MSLRVRRPPRRLVLAAALAAASSVLLAGSPGQAAEPQKCPSGAARCLVVKVVETVDSETRVKTQEVSPEQIVAWSDFTDPKPVQYYKRRNLDGERSRGPAIKQHQGISIQKLLTDLTLQLPNGEKFSPNDVTFSETVNGPDSIAVLDAKDLADPATSDEDDPFPFDDDLRPAIYLDYTGKLGYVRPLRDQQTDINAPDIFTTPGRLTLTINTTGRLLEPTVTSTKGTDITTKDETTFGVTFATKPRTRIDATRWSFGDDTVKGTSRDKPTHRFTKRGTYPVVVTVRGANGSYGRSDPLTIKVDKPPKAPDTSGNGDGSGNVDAPPYDPGYEDAPPIEEPVEPPADPEPPVEQAPVDDGLVPVEGYVLAGAEIVPGGTPEAIPGTQDSSAPTPAADEPQRKSIAAWAIAALTIAVLLTIGAVSETRWTRTQQRHLRRRA